MATCKDCFNFGDCLQGEGTQYYGLDVACDNVEELCKHFKNKADFVEVKHGEWIYVREQDQYRCSECDGLALCDRLSGGHICDVLSDRCPHCGAEMDGRKENK